MGGRGSSSGGSRAKAVAPTPPPIPQAPPPFVGNGQYKQMTDAEAQALIRANQQAYADPEFITAQKMYISPTDVNGDGFSFSQNLNYKLDNKLPLDVNEKWINDNLQSGMHAIGKNTNLVRYCHDDIVRQLGVKDYTKLSQSQLQSQLVGKSVQSTAYISTSYNASKSPFHPNASLGGGREVVMSIKANANTKVVFGAKAQTEVVLNKGTNMRIVGIRFDGTTATPRGKGTRPRVVLDVETY